MSVVPQLADVLSRLEEVLAAEGRAALCQIVRVEGSTPGKPGWKLLVAAGGATFGNLGGGAFEALVAADARAKLEENDPGAEVKRYYLTEEAVKGEATGMVCGGMAEVFLEVLSARPLLVICGGGPVGQAVAEGGVLCGFEPLVADDRPEFRRPELFPEGTLFAAVERDYGADFLAPWAGRELLVAVVSRCWETDLEALSSILRQRPPRLRYLGLMGSRRKVERVRRELAARGLDPDAAGVPLTAPIGLPIGGDSPGEIAVSILAQIVQARNRAAAESAAARAPRPTAVRSTGG